MEQITTDELRKFVHEHRGLEDTLICHPEVYKLAEGLEDIFDYVVISRVTPYPMTMTHFKNINGFQCQ